MEIIPNPRLIRGISPVKQLIIALAVVLLSGLAFFALFLFAGTYIFGIDTGWFNPDSQGSSSISAEALRFLILAQDLSFFIIPAAIILINFNPGHDRNIFSLKDQKLPLFILVILLTLFSFPVISFAGQLNEAIKLPEWLSGVENWIRLKEDEAEDIVTTILRTKSVAEMCLNIFLIAVLPALSEELIFRGVFQKIFSNLFRSGGVAVWVTAFIFSAVHLQFFGFLPRFILGLIFGYIFLWSGCIWIPVTAHFINNAVPVISAYTGRWDMLNGSAGKVGIMNIAIAAGFGALILIIMKLLKRNSTYGNNLVKGGETNKSD